MASNQMCFVTVLLTIVNHFAVGINVTIRGVGTVAGTVNMFLSLLAYFMDET